jgi:hypothetical protein
LICDAVAAQVPTREGKATGVSYIDRVTREPREVRGKVVVLCASTLESTRLLMNSKICWRQRRAGSLRDGSHVSGRRRRDHADDRGEAVGGRPQASQRNLHPRFRNVKESTTKGFIRGYGYQGGSSPSFDMGAPGFGAAY